MISVDKTINYLSTTKRFELPTECHVRILYLFLHFISKLCEQWQIIITLQPCYDSCPVAMLLCLCVVLKPESVESDSTYRCLGRVWRSADSCLYLSAVTGVAVAVWRLGLDGGLHRCSTPTTHWRSRTSAQTRRRPVDYGWTRHCYGSHLDPTHRSSSSERTHSERQTTIVVVKYNVYAVSPPDAEGAVGPMRITFYGFQCFLVCSE